MSSYKFWASNKPLENVENPYIQFFSVNEMLENEMEVADFILNNTNMDRNKKIYLVCDSEEHLHEIVIKSDYPNRYASDYTDKEYISEFTGAYTKDHAKQLVEYIKIHMELSDEIELWEIWMDDDIKTPTVTECKLNELTVGTIKDIFGKGFYKSPECLMIKK